LLAREGIDASGYYSKSWDDLPVNPDVVITVCANAAGETCPAYLGDVVRAHWGVADPAKAVGTEAQIDAAFRLAYSVLRKRIEAFLALDVALLQSPASMREVLNQIGRLE
jgi:arsenate reductase